MDKEEKVLKEDSIKTELVYDGFFKIEKITRKSKEEEITGEVIKKGETVSALIYNTEIKKYLFVEKYKLAANGVTLEVIDGSVEKGEKPEKAIKRVVTEMTGYKVDDIKTITSYFIDTNNSDEICNLFYIEVSEKVVEDLEFDGYRLVEIEKLGLGGKLFVNDPMNLMTMEADKEKKLIPPYQSLDAKTLIGVMWVENNNVLKEVAELITNAKIRSL